MGKDNKAEMYAEYYSKYPVGIDLRNDSIREEDHCEETKLKWEDE
jgi:hypothetical protein